MVEPVEGVDYIIDRYAVLDLTPAATHEEIRAAIKQKRGQNHPDGLGRASDEIKEKAARAYALIEKCASVLTDADKKIAYDEKLEWFKEHEPKLISTSGVPIISLARQYVDLDMLIRGDIPDQTGVHQMLESITANGSPRNVAMMERLYRADPDDAEVKEAYTKALTTRLIALTEQEKLAWAAAGIGQSSKPAKYLTDANDYKETVDEQIRDVRTRRIPERVEQRAAALLSGTGTPLLLPAPEGSVVQEMHQGITAQDKEKMITQAVDTFDSRTHRLKQLGEEKQAVLLKLLDLSEHHDLTSELGDTKHTQIFLTVKLPDNPEPIVVFGQRINNKTLSGKPIEGCNGKTLSELKECGFTDKSYAVVADPELLRMGYAVTHITHLHKKMHGTGQENGKSKAA